MVCCFALDFLDISFLWMISASFKGQNEFFQNRMGLIPVQPTIDNFIRIWQKADFGTYFINTIIVTAFSVIIVLIMTMMAGYAMGRYKFLGRNLCMAVFLASIAIPLVSTIIPTYEVVKGMNLVGTKLGLILSQAGGAHVIFCFCLPVSFNLYQMSWKRHLR